MSVDYTTKSGFGYKISCEEVANMPFEDEDFDKGEKCELPEGFKCLRVGSSYEKKRVATKKILKQLKWHCRVIKLKPQDVPR